MADRNSGETILAFLLGGIIGGLAGILFAPAAGKETRKKIASMAEDTKEFICDIAEEGKTKVVEQKERIESAIEAGKKAYDKSK